MALIYKPQRAKGIEVLSCTDSFEFKPHIHDRYVVWLNTAGGERYEVSGSSDVLSPGLISVIAPGTVHANRPCDGAPRHLRSFYVDEAFFQGLAGQMGKGGENLWFSKEAINDPDLWKRLWSLHELMLSDTSALEMDTALVEGFSSFIKRHGHLLSSDSGGSSQRLSMVLETLQECFDEELSLERLADVAGCSPYHLIRIFKEAKGMTPHAYLTQIRLEKARRMLESGVPISDAAHGTGFSDQSHLTRAFKKRYGLTPGSYLHMTQF